MTSSGKKPDYSDLYEGTEEQNREYRPEPQRKLNAIEWLLKYKKAVGLLFLVIGFVFGFMSVYLGPIMYPFTLMFLVIGGVMFLADEIVKGNG